MSMSVGDGAGYKKQWTFPSTANYLSGKVDWIPKSCTFTIPADAPEGIGGCIMPFVRHAVGNTWIDGVLLEEVK